MHRTGMELRNKCSINVTLSVFQTNHMAVWQSHLFCFLKYPNKQRLSVLTKLRPCIFLELLLSFRDFQPYYSYRLYFYKKKCVLRSPLVAKLKLRLWLIVLRYQTLLWNVILFNQRQISYLVLHRYFAAY